jgi:hypothetical protein
MRNKISVKSRNQAMEVVSLLHKHKIVRIHTRGALDRMIEIVKFPWTKDLKTWSNFSGSVRRLSSGKVTAYKNQQYDPIRMWLESEGYISSRFDGYRYHYTVNYTLKQA